MPEQLCPKCQKPLARRQRKDGGYFWSCTGYKENNCTFSCDDYDGEPFLKFCTECNSLLRHRVSKKSGKSYCACMESEKHASKQPIFYEMDGSPRQAAENADVPEAKGEFTCPECGEKLRIFRVKSGAKIGQAAWCCRNNEKHADGKTKFWDDNCGVPDFR